MDDFSITRPEAIAPASNTGGQGSARNDARKERRPRPTAEPAAPDVPEDIHDEDNRHQIDELA